MEAFKMSTKFVNWKARNELDGTMTANTEQSLSCWHS